jgi:apolipoprotein N-acyltransferase
MGFAFFSVSVYWLFIVTVAGALVLFAFFGVYFVLVACTVRHFVRQRRWPLAFTFPILWVGCEAVRSMTVLQFPWNLLGHSQHAVLPMIQISDLVGAYGVSFVLAAVNGALADAALTRMGWPVALAVKPSGPRLWPSAGFATLAVIATFIYGEVQLHRGTMREGPKVAVIQGNYPNYVDAAMSQREPTQIERADRYFELIDKALKEKPDLVLLPETPWMMYLNDEFLRKPLAQWYQQTYPPQECYNSLRDMAVDHGCYIVTGSASFEEQELQLRASELRYNSAFVFAPDGKLAQRYDKIHLVLIGEYAPFRYGMLRFVYLWLNKVVPFGSDDFEYSLSPGKEFRTFAMQAPSQGGAAYRFATPICYENVMPYISRRFVTGDDGKKRCDLLLNLSNDGWFLHSWELPQHLAASVFRAVENRVGVARAVNTGISCFVDPDGRVHGEVTKDGRVRGPGVDGYSLSSVRVDSRHSVYSQTGDIFAGSCGGLWGVAFLDYFGLRTRLRRRRKEAAT